MRKNLIILATLVLALAPSAALAKVKVITSITPLRAIAEAIGGDLVEAKSIGRGDEDPHFVEVRPSFIMEIAKAQLYVSTGMSLDIWAKPLIENSRNPELVTVIASTGVNILGAPTQRVSPLMGDVHPEGNPHYWMDPYNIPVVVKNILSGLVKVDPSHQAQYQKNAQAFLAALKAKTAEWLKAMAPYKGTKVLTYHESWEYFADRFGLKIMGEEEPKPGIPPSGSHTQELIQMMKSEKVPLIVQENYYSTSTSKMIASNTSAKLVVIPQLCDGAPGTSTYIDLIGYDVAEIVKALKR